jgi:hypothetical protein
MALMHMVEMTIHEVVRMIAVGNSFMPAARAVPVGGFVTSLGVSAPALRRIVGIHFQLVFAARIASCSLHSCVELYQRSRFRKLRICAT